MSVTFAPMRLSREHIAEAAAVMGRALVDDPIFVYVLPDAIQRASGVSAMMETTLRIGLAHGEVWTTPPPIAGVAAWMSPSHPKITEEDRTRLAGGRSGLRGAPRRSPVSSSSPPT
jgi:hypothetical protein